MQANDDKANGTAKIATAVSGTKGVVARAASNLWNPLREYPDDAEAWQHFDPVYRPLLQTWLHRYCLKPQDADDRVQQILDVVMREMPRYDPRQSTFLGW